MKMIVGFLSRLFMIHWTSGKREVISLSPFHLFDQLHRHIDISRAIIVETSPLAIGSSRI